MRFLKAGESHGPSLTAILEGIPAGLSLNLENINRDLARRQKGYGRGGRMKIETDTVRILSGVRFGETLGAPITLSVENRDWQNWQERMAAFGEAHGEKVTAARPGHADLTGVRKYAREDIRDILERASARETAMRVAVGAVAKELLFALGVTVESAVLDIGGVAADAAKRETGAAHKAASELNCFDAEAEERMKEKIRAAKEAGDTLGGIFEVRIAGAPLGLGSHIQWDRRLDARFAAAMMSIQAIKGVEIGAGFACAHVPGSEIHDEIYMDADGRPYRRTNRAGGLEGGMTNGEPLVVRAVMKPIPTLMAPLHTIDIASKKEVSAAKERSDCCAVPAASAVGEAMLSFVLADAVCTMFHADTMTDLMASLAAYRARIDGRWQDV